MGGANIWDTCGVGGAATTQTVTDDSRSTRFGKKRTDKQMDIAIT